MQEIISAAVRGYAAPLRVFVHADRAIVSTLRCLILRRDWLCGAVVKKEKKRRGSSQFVVEATRKISRTMQNRFFFGWPNARARFGDGGTTHFCGYPAGRRRSIKRMRERAIYWMLKHALFRQGCAKYGPPLKLHVRGLLGKYDGVRRGSL